MPIPDLVTPAADFLDSLGGIFNVLLALIVFDVVTGIVAAAGKGVLSSKVSYQGMSKKALEVLAVMAAQFLEPAMAQAGATLDVSSWLSLFFAVTEFLSILENLSSAGVPLPKGLLDVLARVEQQVEAGPASVTVVSKSSAAPVVNVTTTTTPPKA